MRKRREQQEGTSGTKERAVQTKHLPRNLGLGWLLVSFRQAGVVPGKDLSLPPALRRLRLRHIPILSAPDFSWQLTRSRFALRCEYSPSRDGNKGYPKHTTDSGPTSLMNVRSSHETHWNPHSTPSIHLHLLIPSIRSILGVFSCCRSAFS